MRLLREAAVPCGVVQDLAGGFALADELRLEPIATVEGEPTVRNPVRYSATPPSYRLAPPDLDSGRRTVLEWLDDSAAFD